MATNKEIEIKNQIITKLTRNFGITPEQALDDQMYQATLLTIREQTVIPVILMTFDVLKFFKSKFSRFLHIPNILLIYSTFDVSKLLTFR